MCCERADLDEDFRMTFAPSWTPYLGWGLFFTCLICGYELSVEYILQTFMTANTGAPICRTHGRTALVVDLPNRWCYFACCKVNSSEPDTYSEVDRYAREGLCCRAPVWLSFPQDFQIIRDVLPASPLPSPAISVDADDHHPDAAGSGGLSPTVAAGAIPDDAAGPRGDGDARRRR
jgi:hypothetical protein